MPMRADDPDLRTSTLALALLAACLPASQHAAIAGDPRELHTPELAPCLPGPRVTAPKPAPGVPAQARADEIQPSDPCTVDPDPDDQDAGIGCHDLLPPELIEFAGVIVGLEFRVGEAVAPTIPPALTRAAASFRAQPRLRLVISGHGDESEDHDISRQRAELVRSFLIARGLRPDQIEVRAVGAEEPGTYPGRSDRRVELTPSVDHPRASTWR